MGRDLDQDQENLDIQCVAKMLKVHLEDALESESGSGTLLLQSMSINEQSSTIGIEHSL